MTRQELKEIMERNFIFQSEIDDAITFVTELLEHQAKEIKKMNRMQRAQFEILKLLLILYGICKIMSEM